MIYQVKTKPSLGVIEKRSFREPSAAHYLWSLELGARSFGRFASAGLSVSAPSDLCTPGKKVIKRSANGV